MGQPVTVINKASNRKEILSFELNRSITGMGHRNYSFKELAAAATAEKTAEKTAESNSEKTAEKTAENETSDIANSIALSLFKKYGSKGIKSVHINSNVVTMELPAKSKIAPKEITKFLEELFLYYPLK